MAKKKELATLPRTVRIFINDFVRGNAPFLCISESAEDAYIESEGRGDVTVGIYELKEKVKLKFRVDEEPA